MNLSFCGSPRVSVRNPLYNSLMIINERLGLRNEPAEVFFSKICLMICSAQAGADKWYSPSTNRLDSKYLLVLGSPQFLADTFLRN